MVRPIKNTLRRRNVLKRKIKIILLFVIIATIGITKVGYADEISEQTLNPLEVWHDNLTQFTKNVVPTSALISE